MSEAAVTLTDVSVHFGARTALRDVTTTLDHGSVVGVLGPNGAGKSTLFSAILGLIPHDGTIRADGPISFVPQGEHYQRDFPATPLDVALMGRYGARKWWQRLSTEDRDRARAALARMGMDEHAACRFGELSGGQRQRTIIARALAQDRGTILLDEPFTGVDPTSTSVIEEALTAMAADGRCVVISTHDIPGAARLCDRVILLNETIRADGPPAEVIAPDPLRRTYGPAMVALGGPGSPVTMIDAGGHVCEHDGEIDHTAEHVHAEHHGVTEPR